MHLNTPLCMHFCAAVLNKWKEHKTQLPKTHQTVLTDWAQARKNFLWALKPELHKMFRHHHPFLAFFQDPSKNYSLGNKDLNNCVNSKSAKRTRVKHSLLPLEQPWRDSVCHNCWYRAIWTNGQTRYRALWHILLQISALFFRCSWNTEAKYKVILLFYVAITNGNAEAGSLLWLLQPCSSCYCVCSDSPCSLSCGILPPLYSSIIPTLMQQLHTILRCTIQCIPVSNRLA